MSITSTPRQVRYTKPKSVVLRVLDDYVPTPISERAQYDTERWYATSGTRDRDWTGKGAGCYHGTSHDGRSITCEGQRCKFLPRERRTRTERTNRPEGRPASRRTAGRGTSDDGVVTYLRSLGYKGTIDARTRRLAQDAMEHAAQVAAYCAAA